MAVDLAKVSLWLSTLARDHPLTFVDHAFRQGDSLIGLTRRQIEALHWKWRSVAGPDRLRRPRSSGGGIGAAATDPRSGRHRRRAPLAEPLARRARRGRRRATVRRLGAGRVLRGSQAKGAGVTALRLSAGDPDRRGVAPHCPDGGAPQCGSAVRSVPLADRVPGGFRTRQPRLQRLRRQPAVRGQEQRRGGKCARLPELAQGAA